MITFPIKLRGLQIVMVLVANVSLQVQSAPVTRSLQESSSNWQDRLAALGPDVPLDYFELAEEVADAAADASTRDLARHLFALAGALDPENLGRSACLALVELYEDEPTKRRLAALASLLGSGAIQPDQTNSSERSAADSIGGGAALAAAEALGRYRRGQGTQALSALQKPGATDLLREHQHLLPGGLARFLEDCKLYRGQQKPPLGSEDITRLLKFESALLGGPQRSWESELFLTGGRPLIEVDPSRLEESLGVNASKPYFRNGRWVESPAP